MSTPTTPASSAFAGAAADQSDRRQVLRLAGRLPYGPKPLRFLAIGKLPARRDLVHPLATAHKNRMQGNDFVQSLMYNRGVACFSCHDVHGTENAAQLREPPGEMCFACHGPNT